MKKLLSLALVAVMVLSSVVTCFAVSVDAVPTRTNPDIQNFDKNPEDYVVDFWLSDATIGAGETTAQVTANVKNNFGIYAARFFVVYPGCLTISTATANYAKNDPYNPDTVIYTRDDIGINQNQTTVTANLKNGANGRTYGGKTVEELIASGYKFSTIVLQCAQTFLNEDDYENEENEQYFCNTKAVDGALYTFDFTYDAAANTEKATELPIYMINSAVDALFCYGDKGFEDGEFTPVDHHGTITVPKPVSTEPTITVSDANVTVGAETAEFTVTVENNPGLYGLYGFVTYAAPMAATEVTCGEVFDELFEGGPLAEGNEALLNQTVKSFKDRSNIYKNAFVAAGTPDDYIATRIVADDGANFKTNNTNNGTYITFKLDTSKLAPGTYDIEFVLDTANTINIDGDNVQFDTVKGTLTVAECAHDWDLVSTDPADCTNDAVEHYECSKCGATDTKVVADSALGHDHQVTNVEAATCTTPEITTYTCSRCGDTYTEETDVALGHAYNDVVTAPTCTEKGYTTHTCARCGDVYVDTEVAALDHDWIQGETTGNCGEYGTIHYSCSRCSETKTEDGAYIDHVWTETGRTDATCTEKGIINYECSKCGATKSEDIEALGHDETGVVTAPTCTEKGYTTYTCSRCGNVENRDYVDALGHDMQEVNRVPATCTENGRVDYECSRCDATDSEVLEALKHDYKAVVTAPTCTEKGFTTHTCSRCGDSYTDTEVEALGHDYKAVVTAPTCTEKGFTTHTCSRCGDSYTDSEVEALGHDYKAVVTAPTCTEKGFTTHTCSRCGDSYTDSEVDALGHEFDEETEIVVEPTCTEEGYTAYKCIRCDELKKIKVVDALGHSFDEGIVTKAPTTDAEGEKTFTCTVCGEKKTEAIAKLAPEKTDDTTKTDETKDNNNTAKPTGDAIAIIMFIASIALVSGAAVVIAKKKIFNK